MGCEDLSQGHKGKAQAVQPLSHALAFQVLMLQAADEGRGPVLFGDSFQRAWSAVPPFLVGEEFPSVYLEHPLTGDPFLDVTVVLKQIEPGTRVEAPAAGEHGAIFDWYAGICREYDDVNCGFELDTAQPTLPMAAIHFQPRSRTELVRPFFEAAGEPQAADLYLAQNARMPDSWALSFCGMFRGRPGSPLRICGYLGAAETAACADNPGRLRDVFEAAGFSAYNATMLAEASALMAAAPGKADFQLDVFPDGHLGSTFSIDVQFEIEQPDSVQKTFEDGAGAHVMELLEEWGIADSRWKLSVGSAFARALPMSASDGTTGRFCLTLMPQWVKVRWKDGVLQPAKLYHFANATLL